MLKLQYIWDKVFPQFLFYALLWGLTNIILNIITFFVPNFVNVNSATIHLIFVILSTLGVGIHMLFVFLNEKQFKKMGSKFEETYKTFFRENNGPQDPSAAIAFSGNVGSFIKYHHTRWAQLATYKNFTDSKISGVALFFLILLGYFLTNFNFEILASYGASGLSDFHETSKIHVVLFPISFIIPILILASIFSFFEVKNFLELRKWRENLFENFLIRRRKEFYPNWDVIKEAMARDEILRYFQIESTQDLKKIFG